MAILRKLFSSIKRFFKTSKPKANGTNNDASVILHNNKEPLSVRQRRELLSNNVLPFQLLSSGYFGRRH
jgi:hypothetical protein